MVCRFGLAKRCSYDHSDTTVMFRKAQPWWMRWVLLPPQCLKALAWRLSKTVPRSHWGCTRHLPFQYIPTAGDIQILRLLNPKQAIKKTAPPAGVRTHTHTQKKNRWHAIKHAMVLSGDIWKVDGGLREVAPSICACSFADIV